ncbi:diaminohydroxyphosphoribosylaminopyrimidine deaminase [Brevinema andersonii]|uniref:Riboflavin biosynthesis protein RibD n=2 Tax=Brevinema andersonii TaxID=34097 RepID=A0A1I1DNZ1_BREAD|nr:diaminohydroxyphosphoribosylaminopyrimidine deaminase [Brevinema andersonii]
MQKAFDLALKGINKTSPNPLVGAVLVKNNNIIGEGYHQKFGGPHAEVHAIASANQSITGADLYVTLEPCTHYGKTPPCVDLIIENKIKKVFIACLDPNPLVAGQSVQKLRDANIEVEIGILNDKCRSLNAPFFKYVTEQKSFLYVKNAITIDGKIACKTGHSQWISNKMAQEYVHKLRYRMSGILTAIGTIKYDNPQLNVRLPSKTAINQPFKVIIDPLGECSIEYRVFQENPDKIILFICEKYTNNINIVQCINAGAQVIRYHDQEIPVDFILAKCAELGIDSLLVEAGTGLISRILRGNYADGGVFFIAPRILGDNKAYTLMSGQNCSEMNQSLKLNNVLWKLFPGDEDNMALFFGEKLCLPD